MKTMNDQFPNSILGAVTVICLGATTIGFIAYASTDISHDALNRVTTVKENLTAVRSFSYDQAGNRTNNSVAFGFSVGNFTGQHIGTDTTLQLPLATAGSLAT